MHSVLKEKWGLQAVNLQTLGFLRESLKINFISAVCRSKPVLFNLSYFVSNYWNSEFISSELLSVLLTFENPWKCIKLSHRSIQILFRTAKRSLPATFNSFHNSDNKMISLLKALADLLQESPFNCSGVSLNSQRSSFQLSFEAILWLIKSRNSNLIRFLASIKQFFYLSGSKGRTSDWNIYKLRWIFAAL